MPNPPSQNAEPDSPPEQTAFNTQSNAAPPPRNVMAEVIERHERVTNRVKNSVNNSDGKAAPPKNNPKNNANGKSNAKK